jgi:hypothetical protein
MEMDGIGNIYLNGLCEGWIDLDPGEGEVIFNEGGLHNNYLSKLNSNGEFLWGMVWDEYAGSFYDMAVTESGTIYLSGTFTGTRDFEPGPGESMLTSNEPWMDVVLCSFNSNGGFRWCLSYGTDFIDPWAYIETDPDGNLYITSYFIGTIDLDPGPGVDVHTNNNLGDGYLIKLNAGGEFQWSRVWTSTQHVSGRSVAIDGNDVYITGSFRETADFDPGPGTWNFAAVGTTDTFLSKFSSEGDFQWAYKWSLGSGGEYSTDISLSNNEYIYIIGNYLVPTSYYHSVPKGCPPPSAYYDVFLLRYPPFAEL